MGITDKISGRIKKTVGEVLDDEGTRRQGSMEERKGEVDEEAAEAEAESVEKRQEQAELERRT